MKNPKLVRRCATALIVVAFLGSDMVLPALTEAERSTAIRAADIDRLKKKIESIEKSQREILELDRQIRSSVKQVMVFARRGPRRKKKKKN